MPKYYFSLADGFTDDDGEPELVELPNDAAARHEATYQVILNVSSLDQSKHSIWWEPNNRLGNT